MQRNVGLEVAYEDLRGMTVIELIRRVDGLAARTGKRGKNLIRTLLL